MLVDYGIAVLGVAEKVPGIGLVVGVGFVVAEVVVKRQRQRPSWQAEPLAEKQEAARRPVPVVAYAAVPSLAGMLLGPVSSPVVGIETGNIAEVPVPPVQLRAEQDGGILAELVVDLEADTVPVGIGKVLPVFFVDEAGSVIKIGFLIAGGQHGILGTGIRVIAAYTHLLVEEVACCIGADHPRIGDAAAAASAYTSAHAAHHVAGKVPEAACIVVVGIGNQREHAAVTELACEEIGLVAVRTVQRIVPVLKVVTASREQVAYQAPGPRSLLEGKVEHRFLLAVVYTGEFGLLAFLLQHLHLFDDICRDVVRRHLGIVEEESLAADCDLGNGFPVHGHRTRIAHFDSRELLEQVQEHVVVGSLEGRGIVFYRILLDYDGVPHVGHFSCLELFGVRFHFYHAQGDILPVHFNLDGICLVAK